MKVARPCLECAVRSVSGCPCRNVALHDAVTVATAAVGRHDRSASDPHAGRSPTCAFLIGELSYSRSNQLAAAFVRIRSATVGAMAAALMLATSGLLASTGYLGLGRVGPVACALPHQGA